MIRHVYLHCSCHLPQHVLRLTLETTENELPEITVQPLLNSNTSFFKRLYFAFLYLFNLRQNVCMFDDIVLNKEEVDKLATVISVYNLNYKYKMHLINKRENKQ